MNSFPAAEILLRTRSAHGASLNPRLARSRRLKGVWLLVMLAVALPTFGQSAGSSVEKAQTGSVRGTISTTQENASSDLSGISIKLSALPDDGNPLTASTD